MKSARLRDARFEPSRAGSGQCMHAKTPAQAVRGELYAKTLPELLTPPRILLDQALGILSQSVLRGQLLRTRDWNYLANAIFWTSPVSRCSQFTMGVGLGVWDGVPNDRSDFHE